MLLLNKTKQKGNKLFVFQITTQLNLSFKLCYAPLIPLRVEFGLGLVTITFEIFKCINK